MFDMTVRLQQGNGKHLYEQIYEHIRQEIRDGKLLAGERLPSTRSLAEYLQVARSTVDTAYAQLQSEGYLEAKPCRGFFVCPIEDLFRIRTDEEPGGSGEEWGGNWREAAGVREEWRGGWEDMTSVREEWRGGREETASVREERRSGREETASVREERSGGWEGTASVREERSSGWEGTAGDREERRSGREETAGVREERSGGWEKTAGVREERRSGWEETASVREERGTRTGGGAWEKQEEGAGGSAWACDFSPHSVDMSRFPFGVWKKITGAILNDSSSGLFSQGHAQGEWELRKTIGRYLHSSRGVNCRPEQLIVGAGNDYLLLLLEKILGRHVCIAMESPTYKRACQMFRSFAYRIVTVDMDESGMLASGLEQTKAAAAYCMPSHQYPTGIVMPIGRRMELLRWADGEEGRYLIEDDYDSEFRYRGKPVPSLQSSDRNGKVIYMGTFSKSIAPAIRVSYMVLPEPLLERYLENCGFYSCTVSRIDQRVLNVFIRDGYFERHLNKMRKIYKAKHELLLCLLEPFRREFRISGENAGLHLLLTARGERSEEELLTRAAAAGVKVYGLSDSGTARESSGRGANGTVLLGYGGLSQEQIRCGIGRLQKAWLE